MSSLTFVVLLLLFGQNPETDAERVGLLRGVVLAVLCFLIGISGSSSGSSTMDALVIRIVFDRDGEGRVICDFDPAGGSCGISVVLEESVSFLRVNHMPEARPWTLIVSFLSASIVPTRADYQSL